MFNLTIKVTMKNANDLSGLEGNQMRKQMMKGFIDFTYVIEQKINELDVKISFLSESLDMTTANVVFSRIEALKARLSVSSRKVENVQTTIIVQLLKE